MVDLIALAHELARLEALLVIVLNPEQLHECAPLLPALREAIGVMSRSGRVSVESEDLSYEAVRRHFRLTKREGEVLRLLMRGEPNSGVAHALHVSEHTAHHHTERILRKLRVHSRARLPAAIAARFG